MTPEEQARVRLQAKLDQLVATFREFGKVVKRVAEAVAKSINAMWSRWGKALYAGRLRDELEDHRNMRKLTGGAFGTLTHGQVKHRRDIIRSLRAAQ